LGKAMSEHTPEQLKQAFDETDADGSGAIDEAEFLALTRKLGFILSEGEVHTAFLAIDVNGNRRIDFGEFSNWYRRAPK
jgi:Ca2+-binding EF-hand superfamily protein